MTVTEIIASLPADSRHRFNGAKLAEITLRVDTKAGLAFLPGDMVAVLPANEWIDPALRGTAMDDKLIACGLGRTVVVCRHNVAYRS